MERNKFERNAAIYVSTLLCTLSCIVDTISGYVNGWDPIVYWIVWIQMAIILITVFINKIPTFVQGIIYCTFLCNTVFLGGFYLKNYYVEFVFFCGILILASLYNIVFLALYELILSVIAVSVHLWVFHLVPLDTKSDMAEYSMGAFLMIGVGVALYFNVRRENFIKEQLRETARQAAQAEKAKSDFLANMSHEIRTPMNAIIGMCELALREKGLPFNVREYCLQIQNSGRSLVSIINDILDFSKIDSEKMELIEDEFNISSTLNDVVNMAMARMGNKKLEFVVMVDPDIPKGLIGDEIRIRQIMINILTNAIKYTNEGVVRLKVSYMKRDYGINLSVSVRDSGIGISKENLDKLFNAFQQVDTKKNRAVEGTGLGLAITKRLLKKMGGFVNVSSEYGKGSEFRFVIPLKVSDPEAFIRIHEPEKINAACFLNIDKFENRATREAYRMFWDHISSAIPVRYRVCENIVEFQEYFETKKVSHIFVGRDEYLANQQYFDALAETNQVILIQNRCDAITVPENMKCIYKPFYVLPLASIFNNESSIASLMVEKPKTNTFTAPEAKVLLVDDNAINLQVATGLMAPYHMQIITAASAKEAIKALESKDFDLVLMDHMMPEMDGVEATRYIRNLEDDYYKNVPIVALTANAVSGAREMFLENGFNGFVTKPIELSSLDRALKQNLPPEKIERTSDKIEWTETYETKGIKVDADIAHLLDAELGLTYTGNDPSAYLTVLKLYVEKGEEKIKLIQGLYEKEDWKNYVIEVHALKSSSLSIGAKKLSEEAKALEENGNALELDFIHVHHDECLKLYRSVLAAGQILLADNLSEDTQCCEQAEEWIVEEAQLAELLEKIRTAIEDYDLDAIAAAAQEGLGAKFRDLVLSDQFRAIIEAAQEVDYMSASEYLEEIADQCGLEV